MPPEHGEMGGLVGCSGCFGSLKDRIAMVSEKHSRFTEINWENPGFGVDLESRLFKMVESLVLVPALIKEMLCYK